MRIRTVLVFAAFVYASASHSAEEQEQQRIKVYVVANGWHAGILLPATELNTLVPSLRERFPDAANYEIGWGDIGFYQAKEITARLVFEALFASKGSVVHVVGLSNPVDQFLKGSDVAQACVTPEEYRRMSQAIAQAFVRGEDGEPVSLSPGIYGDSQFYKAVGTYGILNTCNRWSASILEGGGLSIHPRISLTASSVLQSVRESGRLCVTLEYKESTPSITY